ncbi:MAG: iron complex outermembrane receptor protein [Glaciecola sp.]|jgi:iron complex outermembrane receptor protein
MKFTAKKSAIAAFVASQLLAYPSIVLAQEVEEDQSEKVEKILVTGSFVRRSENFESPSPLAILDSAEIDAIGAKSIADITQTLTINTGSENTPDAFTQNATTGTSNINLRGLGVSSTLVLLNGKRQVVTAQPNNDGSNFVDTSSLVPLIAINRVEIVKDGASALYGSDAVAGVVNFITKKNYEGATITADYQDGAHGNNKEYILQGLWGAISENSSVMAAISYTNRSPLFTSDRRLSRPQDDTSSLGNPGTFFAGPTPLIDPGCSTFGGSPLVLAAGVGPQGTDVGLCRFDFGDFFSFVPDETRLNAYTRATYNISDEIEWITDVSFARNRSERGSSPSFPILTFPTVPADHPDNFFGFPVSFFGRELGNGAERDVANTESDTFRFSTMLQGELDNGFWELSYTNATNNFLFTNNDTLAQEFQNALRGFGGTSCDPVSGTAGEGGCEYFNPFSTSFSTSPNTQSVIDSFTGQLQIDSKAGLEVVEGFVSTDWFEMDGGITGVAIGAQYRYQDLSQDYDAASNQDRFAFLIGNPDISGSQDVVALFGEIAMPVTEDLDIQIALRYEDYGSAIGDTVDPKLAISYRASDMLSLRGSISTSFRAPSIFQTKGGSTSLQQASDPLSPGNNFIAVRSSGNPDLVPEESTAFNLGFSLEPIDDLSIEVDYWSFDFTDLIIQESFQAILNDTPQDTVRVIRAGDPLNGPLLQVNTAYVNASSLETTGLDLVTSYKVETEVGTFTPSINATYVLKYDLDDPQAGKVEGAGLRNFNNIGVSNPELRLNLGLNWSMDAYSANIFARHIGSYDDDQNTDADTGNFLEVDSHTTFDAQFNIDLGNIFETKSDYVLTVGGVNLTDENPPQVFTNAGFDSKVHDPRGRQIYARLAVQF